MVLCGRAKQCKFKTMWKYDFYLGEGAAEFHNVFDGKPTKWPITKTKQKSALGCTTTN